MDGAMLLRDHEPRDFESSGGSTESASSRPSPTPVASCALPGKNEGPEPWWRMPAASIAGFAIAVLARDGAVRIVTLDVHRTTDDGGSERELLERAVRVAAPGREVLLEVAAEDKLGDGVSYRSLGFRALRVYPGITALDGTPGRCRGLARWKSRLRRSRR